MRKRIFLCIGRPQRALVRSLHESSSLYDLHMFHKSGIVGSKIEVQFRSYKNLVRMFDKVIIKIAVELQSQCRLCF